MRKDDFSNEVDLSEIEAGLERLMPRGLSDDTFQNLESVVEELVEQAPVSTNSSTWSRRGLWQAAAAVALVGVGLSFVFRQQQANDLGLVEVDGIYFEEAIELLAQRTWIESGSDLGTQSVSQSEEVSQGWGYTGIEEERVRHADSGYEVILQREFDAELYSVSSL